MGCPRILAAIAVLLPMLGVAPARAGWGSIQSGGQPWYCIFPKMSQATHPQEAAPTIPPHDPHAELSQYFNVVGRIDFVADFKNHGYQIEAESSGAWGRPADIARLAAPQGL